MQHQQGQLAAVQWQSPHGMELQRAATDPGRRQTLLTAKLLAAKNAM